MDRPLTDDDLDRLVQRYLVERGADVVAMARPEVEVIRIGRGHLGPRALRPDRRAGQIVWVTALLSLLLALAIASIVMVGAPPSSTSIQGFTPVGSLITARADHTATLLRDGRVLVAGGWTGSGADGQLLDKAEIYDPDTGTFTAAGTMTTARIGHTATMLSDGRVLVVGGGTDLAASTAEIFDPITGSFTAVRSSLMDGRSGHTATLLGDGTVLIAGGSGKAANGKHRIRTSAELYVPRSDMFEPTGSMTTRRQYHSALLLADGRVLLVGAGRDSQGEADLDTAEMFDPKSGTFSGVGSMSVPRAERAAVLLADGRVLVVGGRPCCHYSAAHDTAELFDPATGTFSPTGSMTARRIGPAIALLEDGRVLVAGGVGTGPPGRDRAVLQPVATAELYDPASGTFLPTGPMASVRGGATATVLPDGSVLVVGGHGDFDSQESFDATALDSAEVFR